MIIRLKVFEQTLSVVDTKSVPRKGSKDYLVLQFMFSSDWGGLDKLCYLQHGEVSQPIDVVDNLVEVPEWFTQQDSFDVTLFGKSGTQEVPTNVVSLRLEKSNTLWEQYAPEPQPSWLAKVIDLNNHPPIPGGNGHWLLWDTGSGAYVESDLPLPAGGSGGTSDHSKLINRDNADQHPMSAVTGLVEALDGKQPIGDYLTQDNLQSATNAALAQAKASGEFDGADGTTPHIGDNGNWYLGDTDTGKPSRGETGAQGPKGDTGAQGPAGPAGADGKDGAGMDITGATVGQIAKITAVDDTGKPTVWESVDMPSGSGGERWRLVRTINLAENVTAIDISEDNDGNPFALKKIRIYGNTLGTSSGGQLRINVANKTDDKHSILGPYNNFKGLDTTKRYWVAESECFGIIGGKGKWSEWYNTPDTGRVGAAYVRADLRSPELDSGQSIQDRVEFLHIFSNTIGVEFAAGSYIELWGVDA